MIAPHLKAVRNIDPALTHMWGKPLNPQNLRIFEYVGWARKIVEQGETHWMITERAKVFDSSLHDCGGRRPFHLRKDDTWLRWFPGQSALARLVGRRRSELQLAALIGLVGQVTSGHAIYHEAGDTLVFIPHLRPPWHLVGIVEDQIGVSTPKGLWCDRADSEIDDLGLRPIMLELERRQLMRKIGAGGSAKWAPTEKGIHYLYGTDDYPAITLLLEFGLFDRVQECDRHPTWRNPLRGAELWDKIYGSGGRSPRASLSLPSPSGSAATD